MDDAADEDHHEGHLEPRPDGRVESSEPQHAGDQGREAVDRDELLLAAQRTRDPRDLAAEADHGDQDDRAGGRQPREHRLAAAPPPVGGDHGERERQPGRRLDRDRADERRRPGPVTAVEDGDEPDRDDQAEQGVVMRAADREDQQQWVQAEQGGRRPRGVSPASGRSPDEGDRRQAAEHREDLERPDPPGDAERDETVCQQGEQRAVRRADVVPAEIRVDRVPRGRGRRVGVWVERVDHPESGEVEVPEDVGRQQRRADQHRDVGGDDSRPERSRAERPGAREDDRVAAADPDQQTLVTGPRRARDDAVERPRQPPREPAGPGRGNQPGRRRRGLGPQADQPRRQPDQPERADPRGQPGVERPSGPERGRGGRRGRDRPIVPPRPKPVRTGGEPSRSC